MYARVFASYFHRRCNELAEIRADTKSMPVMIKNQNAAFIMVDPVSLLFAAKQIAPHIRQTPVAMPPKTRMQRPVSVPGSKSARKGAMFII
jgi:hypothetical protein